jgi:hypothetical protein
MTSRGLLFIQSPPRIPIGERLAASSRAGGDQTAQASSLAPGLIEAQQKWRNYEKLIGYSHMPEEENLQIHLSKAMNTHDTVAAGVSI